MTSRGPYRRHSMPFKLQLCQDIRAGVLGRRDAQRTHQLSANLIHLWLTQFDRGELTSEEAEASVIAEYEARIGECPVFCVWLIGSMLPERSKDDDDFERTAGRAAEGLQAA